ncbi:hypothetical protein Hypma_014278 [Hypsizygus marmoreus]|uniref:Uncharacterized protein n=1 Tax=Hypsizygus marmoreus TaxID=39966 RepID=A0A369JFE0_HYPMA|nr:hypothetical protein Hypma_014278 [Hypsizygus marmoreus]
MGSENQYIEKQRFESSRLCLSVSVREIQRKNEAIDWTLDARDNHGQPTVNKDYEVGGSLKCNANHGMHISATVHCSEIDNQMVNNVDTSFIHSRAIVKYRTSNI